MKYTGTAMTLGGKYIAFCCSITPTTHGQEFMGYSAKTTSAVAIIALFDILHDHGMTIDDIEKSTGIHRRTMDDPDARITMTQFLKLWEIAEDMTGDRAIGLHLRKHYGRNLMHFVVTLAVNSATLYDALQHWIRYEKLICETDKIDLTREGDHYVMSYTNTSPEHENRWLPEHHLSLATEYARQITQKNNNPIEVRFKHSDPGYSEEYRNIFQCPVLFNQSTHSVLVKKDDLFSPIVSTDPYLHRILKKHADEALKKISGRDTITDRVQAFIIQKLPSGTVDITSTSISLSMDRSTMHRHLKKEGTTFKAVLTRTRQDLAQNYLSQGMTLTQMAYLLGYSDPSTFQRAFKCWFGLSPGEFRKNQIDI